jgi:tRNA nucleotidyltransferase/poly(A) polymerase
MRFDNYLILEVDEQISRWKNYLNDTPMLSAAVDILNKIESKGYQAYIVGGCVRDLILGEPMHDVDICTNCPIEILEKLFKVYDIGKSKDFGIITTKQNGFDFEIAQFREDGKYLDGRRPESVKVVLDFQSDASRRDFTINAMAVDKDGNIIDHFSGQKDIKNKIIRTVGNPKDRFQEDYLRMLRVARFSSRLGFDIDQATANAAKELKGNVTKLAPERIKDELVKAAGMSGDKFAKYILELDRLGILEIILPEVTKMKEFEHHHEHHPEGGVFMHTIAALKMSDSLNPLVNIAILLHDIGKALTFSTKENGIPTYFGHAEESINLVNDISSRLKLSNQERNTLIYAVGNHMRFHNILKMKPSKVAELVSNDDFDVLVSVARADEFSRGKFISEDDFEKIVDTAVEIKERWGSPTSTKVMKLVDGIRVMELTGLKPGKQIGDIIKKTTEWIIDNGISDNERIDNYIRSLA